jgi:hypothetical protein
MISIEELFNSNKYPKWITSNHVFTKLDYIRKVFPTIGLSNFEERAIVDNTKEISSFAFQLMDVIADSLSDRAVKLELFAKRGKIGKKRRANMELMLHVMKLLVKWLRYNKQGFIIVTTNGKITLGIPEELSHNGSTFMKKGAGLFKIYEKLNSILKEYKFIALPNLSQSYQFKNFSSINIPSKEIVVKFSSDDRDGVWDIATMSMRGVSSCQTWDQGVGNSIKIIGSIIDPFTGIIYLTNDTKYNEYGTKMVRRCIVRYVIDADKKSPFLLLEKMYPAFDKPSLDAFVTAIKKRLPDMPIFHSSELGDKAAYNNLLGKSYIPLSDELKLLENKYYPYIDSSIMFKEDDTCKLAKNSQALHISFKKRLPTIFVKAIQSSAFTKPKVKKYGTLASDLMSGLRIKKKEEEDKKKAKADAAQALSEKFVDFVCDRTKNDDPFHYIAEHERDCMKFFMSEFAEKTNKEFAEFVGSNVFNYIDEKLS